MDSRPIFVILGILVALAVPAGVLILAPGMSGSGEDVATPPRVEPHGEGTSTAEEPTPESSDANEAEGPSTGTTGSETNPYPAGPLPATAGGLVSALKEAHLRGRPADMKRLYDGIRELGERALPGLKNLIEAGDELEALLSMNALDGLKATGNAIPGLDELYVESVYPRAVTLVRTGSTAELRSQAVWTVAQCGVEEYPEVLLRCIREDPDVRVRSAALDAMVKGGADGSKEDLLRLIEAGIPADLLTRLHAAKTVLTLHRGVEDPRILERLESALSVDLKSVMLGGATESTRLRFAAVEIYGRIAGGEGNGVLGRVLDVEEDGLVLKTAIEHLVRRGGAGVFRAALGRIAGDEDAAPNARKAAAWAVTQIGK